MAVALEQFVKQLTDSGVIAPGKLENFLPPKATPKDAQELARQLVQSKHLTKFQAGEIYQGRAKSLILGSYTILDKIGAGGMGQVFKAQHRRMDRLVAIKMLPKHVMRDAATVARFEREVRAAAKLEHPNVVAAHDADEANGVHFLVMQYVEGSDLSALVKASGPFPVAKAVNYILQAARGLEFAHGEGVVHRDIKPANLLLDKKGTVKILDMGLARIEAGGDAGTQAELTGTGAVMGTVDYMAPEQALDTKHADARADIYSLGCTLFYLLTAKPMYEAETLTAKLLAHQCKPIPELRKIRDEVPVEVEAVYRKMVAKTVVDRYQTMSEVIAALESFGTGSQSSISDQQSISTNADNDALTFLRDVPVHTTHKPKPTKKSVPIKTGKDNRKFILGAVGAGLLGLAVLAGVLFKLKTKDGTLVVEIDQPDAVVQVLNEEGRVEITRPGEKGTISISVDSGRHRLKIEKDGFVVYGHDFVMESGGTQSIKAKLEPVDDKAAVAATKTPPKQPDALIFADIFNGRDLTGWNVVGDQANWDVDASKGVLTVTGKSGGWLLTNNDYGDFILRLEYQAEPGANSGVAILASPVDQRHLEVQVGRTAEWGTGGVWSDLSNTVNAGFIPPSQPAKEKPGEEWNSLEIGLRSRKLTMTVNGTEVSKLDLDELAGRPNAYPAWKRTQGRIGLQSQANKVRFRNVQVAEIAPSSKSSERWNTPAFKKWEKDVAALPAEEQLKAVVKKLVDLNPGFDGKVMLSNTPIAGPPRIENGAVTEMGFFTDKVTDISPVRVLSGLKTLHCLGSDYNGILTDISPLQGMQLTKLILVGNRKLTDTSPLKGMPLTFLWLGASDQLFDLSPLKDMPLTELGVRATAVVDLSPLRGMKLTTLDIFSCRNVSDLSPLKGMNLESLVVSGTKVSELSLLAGMPLKLIVLDFKPERDTEILRSIKTLENINSKPAAEFWKEVEEQQKGKKLGFQVPGFDAWEKEVTTLPAEEQVKAVVKKLQELNPGFDGKVTGGNGRVPPKIENNVVTELRFSADNVTDISPVRALAGLKFLDCFAGKLSDLSPLQGMSLTTLNCLSTSISDLAPLKGMPLTHLNFDHTQVRDLSPIKGMQLKILQLDHTGVADLSPLKGMPLTILHCRDVKISDLSPLKGMPLTELYCDLTEVFDLSPLAETKLTAIIFSPKKITNGMDIIRQMKSLKTISVGWDEKDRFVPDEFWKKYDAGDFGNPDSAPATPPTKPGTAFNDAAFKKWMKDVAALPAEEQVKAVAKKLIELNPGFDGTVTHKIENGLVTDLDFRSDKVTDISPVRALAGLKNLICDSTQVSDLSPLKGMLLTALDCNHTKVADLSPLKGMSLTQLLCYDTQVSDLSSLKGMPLVLLWCGGTQVSDLSPLKGMPLLDLRCGKTNVTDLTPIKGMPLEILSCLGTQVSDLLPLVDCKNLKSLSATNLKVTAVGVAALQKALPNCKIEWDDPAKVGAGEPIQAWNDPAFKKWMKKVASLPAEEQVKAVVKKLQELNPGFDGKVTGWYQMQGEPTIENGVVTAIGFSTDHITDISPVRALSGLKLLGCPGNKLTDLTPLIVMHLEHLICYGNPITDITPLKNLPLKYLHLSGTMVADISPLAGMKLEWLRLSGTKINDIALLKGMPLQHLTVDGTQVADLSPLKGMPLTSLNCRQTPVSDLSPLAGLPLTGLDCCPSQVTDLSPLAGMKLVEFHFVPKNITKGIDTIRQMKSLKDIWVGWSEQEHFSPDEFWKKYDAGDFGK